MAEYKAGNLVENAGALQWGPGKVVHAAGGYLHIVFRDLEGSQAKKLKADFPALRLAARQSDPILDNLPHLTEKGGVWSLTGNRLPLESLIRRFRQEFPQGFQDERYLKEERDDKLEAHRLFQQQLGIGPIRELLAQGEIGVLAARALEVLEQVNLLDRFAFLAFRDAMKDEKAAGGFFAALVALLQSPSLNDLVFTEYADVVCSLPAARGRVASWPVATVFPYIADPGIHMLLKPEVTRTAAESLGFDLKYDASPNWTTYDRLLRMGRTYVDLLRPFGAIDFIDVQSFIHASCGGKNLRRH